MSWRNHRICWGNSNALLQEPSVTLVAEPRPLMLSTKFGILSAALHDGSVRSAKTAPVANQKYPPQDRCPTGKYGGSLSRSWQNPYPLQTMPISPRQNPPLLLAHLSHSQ